MVGLVALWMPIVLSAVFVFIALMLIHGLLGWHKGDMVAVPGEAKAMEALRGLGVQPGEYRFPFGRTTAEITAPEFVDKMKQGTVAFCCYAMAHWQNWIWWGKGTRFTVTHTLDGVVYALVTGATFGWLWPRRREPHTQRET